MNRNLSENISFLMQSKLWIYNYLLKHRRIVFLGLFSVFLLFGFFQIGQTKQREMQNQYEEEGQDGEKTSLLDNEKSNLRRGRTASGNSPSRASVAYALRPEEYKEEFGRGRQYAVSVIGPGIA